MTKTSRMTLLWAAVALLSLPLIAEDKPVIAVNPVGEPKGLTKGDAVRYFLWYDAAGWHLRTDSGGKAHVFNGSIGIAGGKITDTDHFPASVRLVVEGLDIDVSFDGEIKLQ